VYGVREIPGKIVHGTGVVSGANFSGAYCGGGGGGDSGLDKTENKNRQAEQVEFRERQR
jgi:hypothetical protein